MEKAIRYRLYPTAKQEQFFRKNFGCCRKIWNLMLADKIAYYEQTGKMLYNTPAQYKKEYPYLKEVDSLALANTQIRLESAYKEFFRNKKIGFPKFKSTKHSHKSYTTNNQKGSIVLADRYIKLPKVGKVRCVIHRKPKDDWQLKSVTVSMEADGKFYASVLFHYEASITATHNVDNAVGLDYKSDGLYMDSEGHSPEIHKYYGKAQKRLQKLQRKLSHMIESHIVRYGVKRKPIYDRKLNKCKNIQKQRKKVAKLSCHVANQRKDFLHKQSTAIAKQYDVVCVENLNMKSLANKGFHKGKATMDNGYGIFQKFLQYKLEEREKYFVKVDKFFPSSQICSNCGYRNKEVKDLRIREWICPCCGESHERDVNAAINIHNEGLRILREKLVV